MRIRHVLAYSSGSGAYGGPTSVAINQATALGSGGAEVTLLSGWDGSADGRITGQPFQHKARRSSRLGSSFALVLTPGLMIEMVRSNRQFDIHHVHFSRDLTTLPATVWLAITRSPYVVQAHGMVIPQSKRVLRVFDRLVTLPLMRRASRVLAISNHEVLALGDLGVESSRIELLPNGISVATGSDEPTSEFEVVFLGRLHPRKRAIRVVEASRILRSRGANFRTSVIGPDEGSLGAVTALIAAENLEDVVTVEGPISNAEVGARLRRASVVVMPSEAEPFGMVAIEALSQGTPVVVSDDAGVLEFLNTSPAIRKVDGNSAEAIADAIEAINRSGPEIRVEAKTLIANSALNIENTRQRLEAIYRSAGSPLIHRGGDS